MGLGSFIGGLLGGLTKRPGEAEQRKGLMGQGIEAGNFAGVGEGGFGALGDQLGGEYGYLRDVARGGQSVSAEQLRQGLQQQQAQQQSMAASGPASAAPMNARTAMLGAGRAASAMAGNQAVAGIQERQAAQGALMQALLQQRQQELQAALGSRQNAISGYGGITPGASLMDTFAGPVMGGLQTYLGGRPAGK